MKFDEISTLKFELFFVAEERIMFGKLISI